MTTMYFDGGTAVQDRDAERLTAQYVRVMGVMADHGWHTLRGISTQTGDPEASISARLRDARKERNGYRTIERRYVSRGLHEYRLV